MKARKHHKAEPTTRWVVCWNGFASDEPVRHLVVRRGDRLPADHSAVVNFPQNFAELGAPLRDPALVALEDA